MPREIQISCLKSHSKGSGERTLESRKFHSRGESTLGAQMLPTCHPTLYKDPKSRANIFCVFQDKLESCDTQDIKMIPCCQCWEGDTWHLGESIIQLNRIWRNQGKLP